MTKSTFKKAINLFFSNPKLFLSRTICSLPNSHFLEQLMPDKMYIKHIYRLCFGYELNLKTPTTFNEKLQWLKLYDRNPNYIKMVDKYEVKKYVSDIIGEEYVIPTLGVWDNVEDIEWDSLPNQFVLKCTHDSGGLVICKDKSNLDVEAAKRKLKKSLETNYYKKGREWPYKYVKHKIIAEEYKEDNTLKELRDYKFFCFNGKVRCFKIDYGRHINHHANYYDVDGVLLDFGEVILKRDKYANIEFPSNLSKMIKVAEVLSANIPFVRVDLYNIKNVIYFGEMTFYPAAGFGKFDPFEWDYTLGTWLNLPSL